MAQPLLYQPPNHFPLYQANQLPPAYAQPFQEDYVYNAYIAQQPVHARATGWGTKADSRRPVDPPPVVNFSVKNSLGHNVTQQVTNSFILHTTLCSVDYDVDYHQQQQTPFGLGGVPAHQPLHPPLNSAPPSRLSGTTVVSLTHIRSPPPGKHFFLLNDLSIRQEGQYRLLFKIYESDSKDGCLRLRAQVMSNVITVYSPKTFPGLEMSSELIKEMASQGCKVRVRKESTFKRKRLNSTSTSLGASTDANNAEKYALLVSGGVSGVGGTMVPLNGSSGAAQLNGIQPPSMPSYDVMYVPGQNGFQHPVTDASASRGSVSSNPAAATPTSWSTQEVKDESFVSNNGYFSSHENANNVAPPVQQATYYNQLQPVVTGAHAPSQASAPAPPYLFQQLHVSHYSNIPPQDNTNASYFIPDTSFVQGDSLYRRSYIAPNQQQQPPYQSRALPSIFSQPNFNSGIAPDDRRNYCVSPVNTVSSVNSNGGSNTVGMMSGHGGMLLNTAAGPALHSAMSSNMSSGISSRSLPYTLQPSHQYSLHSLSTTATNSTSSVRSDSLSSPISISASPVSGYASSTTISTNDYDDKDMVPRGPEDRIMYDKGIFQYY